MKTIFVVDDNNTNLLLAEEALEDHYEVITMLTAAVMFELFDDLIPDIILLDIMMPETDGFEALRQLKADARYAGIPVVFLTGRSGAEIQARGFEMGIVDIIEKPFSAPALLERVSTLLEN